MSTASLMENDLGEQPGAEFGDVEVRVDGGTQVPLEVTEWANDGGVWRRMRGHALLGIES